MLNNMICFEYNIMTDLENVFYADINMINVANIMLESDNVVYVAEISCHLHKAYTSQSNLSAKTIISLCKAREL